MQAQQQGFIVRVAPPAPERENVSNVIVSALGLTGALILAAVVSGATLAAAWILIRKWRRTYEADAPPSLGSAPLGPPPPSHEDR